MYGIFYDYIMNILKMHDEYFIWMNILKIQRIFSF